MQILRQLMVKKLYGKYYPISDKSKFLMEHKQYFLKLLDEQIRYTKGTMFIAYKHYGEHVYPEYTIFGCPNMKNIMKNQQARQFVANQVEPLQEISIRLYEIQNKLKKKKNDEISIDEVVAKKLAAMDLTASIMCMEQKMPMLVFGLDEKDSIVNTVHGKFSGTKVTV